MKEPANHAPKTLGQRMATIFKPLAEKQKPAVQTAAKRMDAAAARVLAALNDLLRRFQKK